MFYNAHFLGEHDVPYIPDDFMESGDRQKRQQDRKRELLEVARANAKLGAMRPGTVVDGLPEWAKNRVN